MDSILQVFNGTHGITSINHLPIEILGDIFLLCILHRCELDQPIQPKRNLAPLWVSQVCRHWREIALSVPSLWCSLVAPHGAVARHPKFTKVWLARSRKLPLSLHLAPPFWHESQLPVNYAHIFDIFLNEVHRWRTISLVLDENLARQFIATVDAKPRNLEELELYFLGNITDLAVDVSSLLPSFSKLRKLSWKGRRIHQTSQRIITFHQLTHIHISLNSAAWHVLPCLTKCTNAVEIYWNGIVSQDLGYVGQFPQTPLLQLQILKLHGYGDLIYVLSRLTLPSLKCLHIQRPSSTTWDHRLLQEFFNRSSCPLQRFILQDDLDLESAVKCLTIPFLGSIPDIEVHLRSSVHLDVFRELKDSHTPTLDRLKIAYPYDESSPVLMWE